MSIVFSVSVCFLHNPSTLRKHSSALFSLYCRHMSCLCTNCTKIRANFVHIRKSKIAFINKSAIVYSYMAWYNRLISLHPAEWLFLRFLRSKRSLQRESVKRRKMEREEVARSLYLWLFCRSGMAQTAILLWNAHVWRRVFCGIPSHFGFGKVF